MTEQQTCGRGVAEHAAIPAKLGEFAASMGWPRHTGGLPSRT